jgi:hypothetical protein
MVRTRPRRRQRAVRRGRAGVRAFTNPGWMENVMMDCGMSSTVNTFRMTYSKLVPSLASSPRSIRLASVSISIPPVPYTVDSATVQIFMVDQVTSQSVPMTTGRVLSTTNPRSVNFRVPRIFERFNQSNSTEIAFILVFRFPTNQTFKSYCRVITKWFVSPDPLTDSTPIRALEELQLDDHGDFNIVEDCDDSEIVRETNALALPAKPAATRVSPPFQCSSSQQRNSSLPPKLHPKQ